MHQPDLFRAIADLAVKLIPGPFERIIIEATAAEHSVRIRTTRVPPGDRQPGRMDLVYRLAKLLRQLHEQVRRSDQERWHTARLEITADRRFSYAFSYEDGPPLTSDDEVPAERD